MKSVYVNRYIFGSLLAFSVKTGKVDNMEKALGFLLSPITRSIANSDGNRRQTSKSKLVLITDSRVSQKALRSELKFLKEGEGKITIDCITLIQTMAEIPSTFE